jgi:hypothetical protein
MVPGDTEYVIAYNPSRRRMLLVINEGGGSGGSGKLKELTASILIVGVAVCLMQTCRDRYLTVSVASTGGSEVQGGSRPPGHHCDARYGSLNEFSIPSLFLGRL